MEEIPFDLIDNLIKVHQIRGTYKPGVLETIKSAWEHEKETVAMNRLLYMGAHTWFGGMDVPKDLFFDPNKSMYVFNKEGSEE